MGDSFWETTWEVAMDGWEHSLAERAAMRKQIQAMTDVVTAARVLRDQLSHQNGMTPSQWLALMDAVDTYDMLLKGEGKI